MHLLTSAILAIGVSATSVSAIEWDTLYSRGNWRLDINYYDDGSRSCESRTVNSQDFVFSLFTWDDGDYVSALATMTGNSVKTHLIRIL